jgi:hypothetical protein
MWVPNGYNWMVYNGESHSNFLKYRDIPPILGKRQLAVEMEMKPIQMMVTWHFTEVNDGSNFSENGILQSVV